MNQYTSEKVAVLCRTIAIARNQMQRASEFIFYNVEARVRLELLRLCTENPSTKNSFSFNHLPTHDDIAREIGTRREAVSRAQGKLQAEGLITRNHKQHKVHDILAVTESTR